MQVQYVYHCCLYLSFDQTTMVQEKSIYDTVFERHGQQTLKIVREQMFSAMQQLSKFVHTHTHPTALK